MSHGSSDQCRPHRIRALVVQCVLSSRIRTHRAPSARFTVGPLVSPERRVRSCSRASVSRSKAQAGGHGVEAGRGAFFHDVAELVVGEEGRWVSRADLPLQGFEPFEGVILDVARRRPRASGEETDGVFRLAVHCEDWPEGPAGPGRGGCASPGATRRTCLASVSSGR